MGPSVPAGALIFLAVGVVLSLGALAGGLRKRARLARFLPAVGVLVGHRVRRTTRDGRRRTVHHPLVEFMVDGRVCVHESDIGRSQPRDVGTQLPIRYNPADPTEACIDELGEMYFVPLVSGAIGVVMFGVGIWVLQHG